MATSIGQYAPVFLPGEPPLWQRSLAGHSPQGCKELDRHNPKRINTNFMCLFFFYFLPVAALPQWELSVKVVQLLDLQGPWGHQVFRDTDCLHRRSYGPIRISFQASCSWHSEGLFGQSFSVAPPIQALRGIPCLGFFSVVLRPVHRGAPLTGVLLCRLVYQALKGAPWVGS